MTSVFGRVRNMMDDRKRCVYDAEESASWPNLVALASMLIVVDHIVVGFFVFILWQRLQRMDVDELIHRLVQVLTNRAGHAVRDASQAVKHTILASDAQWDKYSERPRKFEDYKEWQVWYEWGAGNVGLFVTSNFEDDARKKLNRFNPQQRALFRMDKKTGHLELRDKSGWNEFAMPTIEKFAQDQVLKAKYK